MKRFRLSMGILWWILPLGAWSQGAPTQESAGTYPAQFRATLLPIEFGFRFDDNVFKSVDLSERLADEAYLLNAGCRFNAEYDIFKAEIKYGLDADQYQFYSELNNIKDDFEFSLGAEPGDFNIYYRKGFFLRNSFYDEFDYWEDNNLVGIQWSPSGPWNYEAKGRYFSRQYYSGAATIQAQNFIDQGALIGVQREFDDKFSVKLEGSYNNRQFNRSAVGLPEQIDETWSAFLNFHLYLEGILQDINFGEQRTNSNTLGFSNTVQSVSWAAVVRPSPAFYLQLLFRLFSKSYDVTPPSSTSALIGFVDEDSQDLLSAKASWELSPQWTVNLGLSRTRNESIQPGQFYIENILSAAVQRRF